MPFEIVRNDITLMEVDAVVNTANTLPLYGPGVDAAIHKAAGEELLAARQRIGCIAVGDAAITPGYRLHAKYVIHTVGPRYEGGGMHEEEKLRSCYEKSLALAKENACESVAFPLISAGNEGFPKALALKTALDAAAAFLLENEMTVYLVVFDHTSYRLSEKLTASVKSYIDENYVEEAEKDELSFGIANMTRPGRFERRRKIKKTEFPRDELFLAEVILAPPPVEETMAPPMGGGSLEELLKKADAGFSETLLRLIDESGKTDAEVYKKANVDRKLFSKIRGNIAYRPSKTTALAFAVALELSLEETRDLLSRAGFALSRSSKLDIIVEYFLSRKEYDIFAINAVLFDFDQPLLGGR